MLLKNKDNNPIRACDKKSLNIYQPVPNIHLRRESKHDFSSALHDLCQHLMQNAVHYYVNPIMHAMTKPGDTYHQNPGFPFNG